MIVIAVIITTVDGKGDEYLTLFKKLAPQVRREPGVVTFDMHRKLDDPNKFFLLEQYEDEAAIEARIGKPYFKAFRQATADLVKSREAGRYQVIV